jgi:hypothetical protein
MVVLSAPREEGGSADEVTQKMASHLSVLVS